METTPEPTLIAPVAPMVFNGIGYADAEGVFRWAPCIPFVELEAGVTYRIEVRDGRSYVTRVDD